MSNHLFLDRINTTSTLIADGATGTNLIARGLPSGAIAESWVLEQPEKIIRIRHTAQRKTKSTPHLWGIGTTIRELLRQS
jgi:hypothetical protein